MTKLDDLKERLFFKKHERDNAQDYLDSLKEDIKDISEKIRNIEIEDWNKKHGLNIKIGDSIVVTPEMKVYYEQKFNSNGVSLIDFSIGNVITIYDIHEDSDKVRLLYDHCMTAPFPVELIKNALKVQS